LKSGTTVRRRLRNEVGGAHASTCWEFDCRCSSPLRFTLNLLGTIFRLSILAFFNCVSINLLSYLLAIIQRHRILDIESARFRFELQLVADDSNPLVICDKKAGKRPAPSFLRPFLDSCVSPSPLLRRPVDRQGRKALVSRNRSQHPSVSIKHH